MTEQAKPKDGQGSDLSALVDGELVPSQVLACLEQADDTTGERWAAYQLISEALRAGPGGALPEDKSLTRSIMAACAAQSFALDEQPLGAAAPGERAPVAAVPGSVGAVGQQAAAQPVNDPGFRWSWWAGAAAGVAAVSVALNVWQFQTSPPDTAASVTPAAVTTVSPAPRSTVVETQVTVVAGQPPQTMLRDPRLDELLQAHRQAGATSALQSPAGFLRNATFQAPQP